VRMEFNLSDSYKTSVLSGLAPVTILDIASRAMVSPSATLYRATPTQPAANPNSGVG